MQFPLFVILLLSCVNFSSCIFLERQGKDLLYDGQKVFLSGVNIAWNSYGYDFGNGNYNNSGPILEQWIQDISNAGGNSLRIWVHVEGLSTPAFDSDGYVVGPDNTGDFINDLSRFLDVADEYNVFVIPVLWNGAYISDQSQNYLNLFFDDSKLSSYIENALRPIVRTLKDKPALAAWEVINEVEGSIQINGHENPCFDTNLIGQYGAGWTGKNIPMENALKFINLQNAAIRAEDPKALITVSSWSEHSHTDAFSDCRNHYKDACLIAAGGEASGVADIAQIHTYSWQGNWNENAPFTKTEDDYFLDIPLVIGEFSSACAMGEGVDALWNYGYDNSYSGLWSWQYNAGGECTDTKQDQDQGMTLIQDYTHNGQIPVNIQ